MEEQPHFKRIEKEMELLSSLDAENYSVMTKEYGKAMIVYVSLSAECFPELREDPEIKSVKAEIILDQQYPFMAPIFLCKTKFCTPSFVDGRDLTSELMGRPEWAPTTTIIDLIKAFPKFVSTVLKEKNFNRGCFHLGSIYFNDMWMKNSSFNIFRCRDIYPQERLYPEREIFLSENAFLLLEPKIDQPGQALLIAWGFLESLVGIRLYSEKYITLSWLVSGKKSNIWELSLELLDNPRKAFQIILSKMENLQEVEVHTQKEIADLQLAMGGLKEEEVTLKSIMQMDINIINENIAIYESNISNELTITTIQILMLLYQKAIEYYSALGHSVHEGYLKKLHDMIQSKEIQAVLSETPISSEEPKPNINKLEKDKEELKNDES